MKRPPKAIWIIAATIALLRAVPFVATLVLTPPAGRIFLRVGYLPEDMLQYLSFIRQVPDAGSFFFENHFTTIEQSGRFILLFHWILGVASKLSGLAPHWVLELSRIPLVFLFFWTVWWFLEPIFERSPNDRQRIWATVCIGLSGGIDGFIRPLANLLPDRFGTLFVTDTWHLLGWSTFASLYNPLWIAGFTLYLVVLRRILRPAEADRRERPHGYASIDITLVLGLFLLFFLHPYSAIPVFAVALARPIVQFLVERTVAPYRLARDGLTVTASLGLIAVVGAWQLEDPVFRVSAGGLFGQQIASPFWYPWTLAVVLALALRSGTKWMESRHPYRSSFIAWIGVVVLLHSSNLINGYHFVSYLHLPMAILVGAGMPGIWDRLIRGTKIQRLALKLLLLLLFATPVLLTVESGTDLPKQNLIPRVFVETTIKLASLPPGRVLAPPILGQVIAAHTAHKVWAGHWFMTPEYWPKVELYGQLISDPTRELDLHQLLEDQRIDYLVVPRDARARILEGLGSQVAASRSVAGLEIIQLIQKVP